VLQFDASPSTAEFLLPPNDRAHPHFHTSELKLYWPKDVDSFSSREPPRPDAIDVDGRSEYFVEKIVDERTYRRKKQYMVKWVGYPDEEDSWEPLWNVEDTAALDAVEAAKERGAT
jgi:hypothetical protein